MGQNFYLFNVDKYRRIGGVQGLEKFGEWFPSGGATILTDLLLRGGEVKFPKDPFEGQPYKLAIKANPFEPGICDLAPELICTIFDEIDTPGEVFSLCLTSSYLWRLGFPRFKKMYETEVRSVEGSWAGDRLICLGDYADDYPEGMMTEEELVALNYPELEPYRAFADYCSSDLRRPLPYEWDWREFPDLEPGLRTLYKCLSKWTSPTSRRLKYRIDDEIPWVLRNLSKKVYVRADVLALEPEHVDGPWITGMSFGSLVASRVCWSSDSSMGMAYSSDHDLHRGIRAGDRFEGGTGKTMSSSNSFRALPALRR